MAAVAGMDVAGDVSTTDISMPQDFAPRRAVVLGASNVFRNLSTVVETAQHAWGGPLDLLIAAGHGRSYGLWNQVLGYSVPGIERCGLWETLDKRSPAPTAALITDVGNDLLYNATPETILGWVERCLERLRPRAEKIVLTELPLASVAKLSARKFTMFRTLLFPASRITWQQTWSYAQELNAGLLALAKNFSCQTITPQAEWFGIDPIHLRRARTLSAWRAIFAPWCDERPSFNATGSLTHWARLRMARVHHQRFLRFERIAPQPAMRYDDGSSVSLY